MKNILLLYKKLWAENRTIIILYLLLLIMVSAVMLGSAFGSMAKSYIKDGGSREDLWWYENLMETAWAFIGLFISCSLVISIHWCIRHFNYSPQSYHYNTLPLSIKQKFGFIVTCVFLLLPAAHILLLSIIIIAVSTIGVASAFHKTPWEFYTDILHFLPTDEDIWFAFSHIHIFIAIFLLVAMFFNKMGFIKTLATAFILMLAGMALFYNLNSKVWEARGDFGSKQSVLRFPELYTLHFTCTAVLLAVILYTVYQRLTDKNY